MNRVFKTGLLWVMVLGMCLGATTGFAQEILTDEITPMYEEISALQANLSISSGSASCSGRIRATDQTQSSKLSLSLQKRASGSSTWTTVATWTDTASGTSYAVVSKSISVSRGFSYRVRATGRVYNSNGTLLETGTKYSTTVSY